MDERKQQQENLYQDVVIYSGTDMLETSLWDMYITSARVAALVMQYAK